MGDDQGPVVEQVVALVEDHRAHAHADQVVHQGDGARVQHVAQAPGVLPEHPPAQLPAEPPRLGRGPCRVVRPQPGDPGPCRPDVRLVTLLDEDVGPQSVRGLAEVLVRVVRGGDALVGEHGDGRSTVRLARHRRRDVGVGVDEPADGPPPLLAHGCRRHEDDRAPAQVPDQLEPENRLAGSWRRHDVQPSVRPVECRVAEDGVLVTAQLSAESHRRQGGDGDLGVGCSRDPGGGGRHPRRRAGMTFSP
jgi:hypothetical protein